MKLAAKLRVLIYEPEFVVAEPEPSGDGASGPMDAGTTGIYRLSKSGFILARV